MSCARAVRSLFRGCRRLNRRDVDVGALPGVGEELAEIARREAGESGQNARQVALRVEPLAARPRFRVPACTNSRLSAKFMVVG